MRKLGAAHRPPRKQTWHIPFGVSELGGDVVGCALTGASMRGVPNRVFLTGGYIGVFFTFLLGRWCPFLGAQIVSACLL